MVDTPQLVATVAEKQALYHQSQLISDAITGVDMESGAVAAVAAERGLPFVVVRTVADPVSSALPNAVVDALEASGRVNMIRLLSHLLRHPGEIGGLIALGRHFSDAQKILSAVAQKIAPLDYCRSQAECSD